MTVTDGIGSLTGTLQWVIGTTTTGYTIYHRGSQEYRTSRLTRQCLGLNVGGG